MKNERLARILGLIDEDLIAEGENTNTKRKIHWLRWSGLAACLCIVALGAWLLGGGLRMGASAPESESPKGGLASGVANGTTFMSYAGPVFPLTLSEASDVMTAERSITMDFEPYLAEDYDRRLCVTDNYVLTNSAAEDITVTGIYPVTGSLFSLQQSLPEISVEGTTVETQLHVGAYSGGFVLGNNMNLEQPNSWEDYKALLSDGSYLTQSFTDLPVFNEPVIVYEIMSGSAPEEYDAATMAFSLELDSAQTEILSFDFNGGSFDGNRRRYSYFIDEWQKNSALLIVRGADILSYSTQGYEDGGCNAAEKLNIESTVTRTEMTLGEAFRLAAERHHIRLEHMYGRQADVTVPSAEQLYRAAFELFLQYGTESEKPMARYDFGRLDDLFDDAHGQRRLLYNSFEVTVPAGGSVRITASMTKAPNFDYRVDDPEKQGLNGYDLVTTLGSNLHFTAQTATVETRGIVDIVRQNFGFDPENGVTTVTLDPSVEHYWLEVRRTQNQ